MNTNTEEPSSGALNDVVAAGNSDRRVLALQNATIGVLTVLPYEFQAVCTILGCEHETSALRRGGGRTYKLGVVKHRASQESHIVAVAQLLDAGTNPAAVSATLMLQDCPAISNVIMCGIAGAVPNPARTIDHVRIGDIVVSGIEGVRQYDYVKKTEQFTENRARPRPPSSELLAAARLLKAEELVAIRPWDKYIAEGIEKLGSEWRKPPTNTDVLREPHGKEHIRRAINGIAYRLRIRGKLLRYPIAPHPFRLDVGPFIFHGLIASANDLQKNPFKRNKLRDDYGAKAIEMEGSGVADATYQLAVPYFIVRGTVDYCNDDKNDAWHYYAALAAAAYTKALLEATPPRYLSAPTSVLVSSVTEAIPQTASAFAQYDPIVQQIIVNGLIPEGLYVANLGDSSSNANVVTGSTGNVTKVELPRFPASRQDGVHVSVSVSFTRPQLPAVASPADVADPSRRMAQDVPIQSETTQLSSMDKFEGVGEADQDLLSEDARRQLDELIYLQSVWEFDSLFERAASAAKWIERHRRRLHSNVRSEFYERLARVEILRARQATKGRGSLNLALAKEFMQKARNGND